MHLKNRNLTKTCLSASRGLCGYLWLCFNKILFSKTGHSLPKSTLAK